MRLVFIAPLVATLLSACAQNPGAFRDDSAGDAAHRDVSPRGPAVAAVEDFSRFSLAVPTGDRATSAMLIEKLAPREARLNRPFDYTLRITNLTAAVMTDIVVRERLPESFELTKSEPPVASAEGGWARYTLPELAPLATRSIQVTGIPRAEGTLASAIAVDYKLAARAEVSVVNPILKLVRHAPADVDLCDGVKVRYVASNIGTGTERGVVITERLPEGLVTDAGKDSFTYDIGDLGQGMSREVTVLFKPLKTGKYTGQAVSRAAGGPDVKSESATTAVHQPMLAVAVSGPPTEYLNKSATYCVTVKNTGDAPARKVGVIFNTQGRAQVTAALLNEIAPKLTDDSIEIGVIPPGETRTVSVTLRPTVEGPFTLTARAIAPCAADASAKAETTVLTLPALRLEVIDLDDPIRVGGDVVYRVTVKNTGTGPDHNLALTATLPAGLKFSEAQGPTDAKSAGQTLTFAPLETLRPGDSAVWRIQAKAITPGDVRVEVRLKSDSLKEPATETEPTRLY